MNKDQETKLTKILLGKGYTVKQVSEILMAIRYATSLKFANPKNFTQLKLF